MAIIKCPYCGQDTSDNSGRCSFCGHSLHNGKPDMPVNRDGNYESNNGGCQRAGCVIALIIFSMPILWFCGYMIHEVGFKSFISAMGILLFIVGGFFLGLPYTAIGLFRSFWWRR